ncbi:MAG: hypothetical protein JKY48_15930 [Flavobacteriales bacterium]|nr:hypothetical protein [Flavobacteriales bacterium]
MNESIKTQINVLVNSTSRHTAKSNSRREIDVNTSTASNDVNESEQSITRELENINRSRVLNFVFRQLLQEFMSITYLHDVSFIYSNGYPSQRKSCKLSGLENMLSEVLVNSDAVDKVKNMIYTQLCSIVDYEGSKHSLIEKVTEKFSNCINPEAGEKDVSYVRVRQDLEQAYNGRAVKGIIMDVTSRILKTPSLVVDALLGQGEALDCYNMKLQEAATVQAELSNKEKEQAMKIIEAIVDPKEKASLYKKVFGDCCEQVDCNDNKQAES